MSNPDSITVTTIEAVDSVVISPAPTVDAIDVNTVQDISNLNVGFNNTVTEIAINDDPATLDVSVSLSDFAVPVLSVNGKTGAVVIDYPDIGAEPVNQVKYTHIQNFISNTWTIEHNLNFYPSVTILDNSNNIIEAHLVYDNANTVTIVFNSGISGRAYLS